MHNDIRFYWPAAFIGKAPRYPRPEDDLVEYGVRLDLTTELTWYTYDWGWGFTIRLLGFGFEYSRYGC